MSKRRLSETVAALAAEHDLDQVVVMGWGSSSGHYLAVAHGKTKADQKEADSFAARLMEGLGVPERLVDKHK